MDFDPFSGESQFSTSLTRMVLNEALGSRPTRAPLLSLSSATRLVSRINRLHHPVRSVLENEVSSLPDSFRAMFVTRDAEGRHFGDRDVSEDLVKTRRSNDASPRFASPRPRLDSIVAFGNARCDRALAVMHCLL
ncbi:MAG TPA: hypothetical protein VNL91_01350 [Thermoanaerobaculia bacterium]|nr:hypothetical protein [Thermoanaerobaculia bacterium]